MAKTSRGPGCPGAEGASLPPEHRPPRRVQGEKFFFAPKTVPRPQEWTLKFFST